MAQSPHEQQRNRNQPLADPRPVVKRFLDRYTHYEAWKLDLLDRSPSEFTQGSTLTDTQFDSTPPRHLLFDENKGSDSSQFVDWKDRFNNPVNDLGSQNSITTEICTANFDYQHRCGFKRSNSAVVSDGPEFNRTKIEDMLDQYNSDITDYGEIYVKDILAKKQSKLWFNFPASFWLTKRDYTYVGHAEKLTLETLQLAKDTFVKATDPVEFIDSLPPVSVEQL